MDVFSFVLDSDFNINASIHIPSLIIIFFLASVVIGLIVVNKFRNGKNTKSMDVNEVKLSFKGQGVTIKPNYVNIDIAYKIWVELHTRKIGLPINLEEDVITELYDSWYGCFKLIREMIKEIPSTKFKNDEHTQKLIAVTIEILNDGLRSHLTSWQAKFRRWYAIEIDIKKKENNELSPQQIQQKFPEYEELTKDLIKVNNELIEYTNKMYQLAFDKLADT